MDKLNEFLTYRDVSSVRHKLSAPWDDAHERTKCRYTSKAKESVREVLEVIPPGQSEKLWAALGDNVQAERSQAEIELKVILMPVIGAQEDKYYQLWQTRYH